jgi:hypothetical protein
MRTDGKPVDIKLPSGRVVTMGPKSGMLAFQVDVAFAGKSPAEREYRWAEEYARRLQAIGGQKVAAGYGYVQLLADFTDGELKVITYALAAYDNPTPEELAAALEGGGMHSAEALKESVALHRASGGAIPFERAMELDEASRKMMLATFAGEARREQKQK